MANEIPSPLIDPSQAQVLLASNLADDDLLWVVRCSVLELHRLFASPVAWVAALSGLPGWRDAVSGQPSPDPVLSRDFVLTVEPTEAEDPDGWVSVQGISGTNVLKVLSNRAGAIRSLFATDRVAEATAAALGRPLGDALRLTDAELLATGGDPFGPFWDDVSRDPDNPPSLKKKFLVSVLPQLSRGFGHFEVIDPNETAEERAQRLATFLLGSVFDRDGLAQMLDGLDRHTLYVRDGHGEPGNPPSVSAGAAWTAVYASVDPEAGASPDGPPPPPQPPISCLFVDGRWQPSSPTEGAFLIDDGVLKRWGIE